MGKPEGSRPHEACITTTHATLTHHGWTVARVRNQNIALFATKAGRIRLGGHAAYNWPEEELQEMDLNAELITIGQETDHADLRQAPMQDFFQAILSDLHTACEEWRMDGWRVIQQYYPTSKGYIGFIQPDGLAARGNEAWAIEATSTNKVASRLKRYADYDGIICTVFDRGQILRDGDEPRMSIELWQGGRPVSRLDGSSILPADPVRAPNIECPTCGVQRREPCRPLEKSRHRTEVPTHVGRLRLMPN